MLRELVRAYGETAYLTKLRGVTVEFIAMELPQAGEKSFVQPGRVMPFHASASAKAIFAFQTPEMIDRLLAEPRTRFTSDTKMEDAEIRAELARVRNEGFSVCDNEVGPRSEVCLSGAHKELGRHVRDRHLRSGGEAASRAARRGQSEPALR